VRGLRLALGPHQRQLVDSPVVMFTRDGKHALVADDRLRCVTAKIKQTGDTPDLRLLAAGQQLRRNKPGGYWIVATDPKAAQHAITRQWPINEVVAVLMTTDGLSDGVTYYRRRPPWAKP
jgi:hypothetical protein